MTDAEFKQWLKKHRSCFTGLNAWFSRLPKPGTEREGEPNVSDVLKRWYSALRDIELANAEEATEAMFAGRLDEPKGYDRHPASIRAYALRLRDDRGYGSGDVERRYVDGHEIFRCAVCEDEGWVPIWHPATVKRVADSNEIKPPLYHAIVPCMCGAGKRRQKSFPNDGPFSEQMFCRIGIGGVNDDQERELLQTWIKANMQVQPLAEFAAYG